VSGPAPAPGPLESLRLRLNETEAELRGLGYTTDRCVYPPGAFLSHQVFEGEVVVLLLYGRILVTSNQQSAELHPGGRVRVPSGVPFSLRVLGETSAYWIQAFRPDEKPRPALAREEGSGFQKR